MKQSIGTLLDELFIARIDVSTALNIVDPSGKRKELFQTSTQLLVDEIKDLMSENALMDHYEFWERVLIYSLSTQEEIDEIRKKRRDSKAQASVQKHSCQD